MARNKAFDESAVLDKAVQLFWAKGYNATSASDLVEYLGLSRSSLYDTYGDKRALFLQALVRYDREMSGKMIDMVRQSDNLKATFAEMMQMVIQQDTCTANTPKGCFVVNTAIELATHDAEVANIVNSSLAELETAMDKAIKKAQGKGAITTAHTSKSLARFFVNTVSGLRVTMKSRTDPKVLNDIVRVSLSILD
jgi:TetR/AcrR family transcriptional regulator, transcriptional repressor for nem operon